MICCERWKLWHFYSIVGRWSRNSQHPKLKTSKCFLEEKKCFSWKKKACFSSYYLIRSHLFYTKIMDGMSHKMLLLLMDRNFQISLVPACNHRVCLKVFFFYFLAPPLAAVLFFFAILLERNLGRLFVTLVIKFSSFNLLNL